MTCMLMLFLSASSGLTLHLAPQQNDILVGEPLRLALTWHANRTLQLPAEVDAGGWNYDYLQIWVDGPFGRHRYREIPPMIEERVIASSPLTAGNDSTSELLLLYGRHVAKRDGFLFPTAGTYTIMVRYADDRNPAESNTITVRVKEPDEAERVVLDALKTEPNEIRLGGPKAQRLLEKHPSSRYLCLARIARYHEREGRLLEQRDPETGEPVSVPSEQWSVTAANAYRRMSEDLAASEDWGAYEDVRLALLAEYARRGGDSAGARRAKDQVLTRFPRSRVADQIRSDDAKELERKQRDKADPDGPNQ